MSDLNFLRLIGGRACGLFVLVMLAQGEGVLGQPVNDQFAERIRLEGETVETSGSNVGASLEANEPSVLTDFGGGTLWWTWRAPSSGRVTVSTAGSEVDTLLVLFTGLSLPDLETVAENDDEDLLGGIFTSRLSFFARAGTTYQIAVAGISDGSGGFDAGEIELSIESAPAEPAPAWSATDINGQPLSSEDFEGKVVVLDFWATWCSPCRAEIPIFVELQDEYGSEGLAIIGVTVDTVGPEAVKEFMEELEMNYPVFYTSPELEEALGGVSSIPTAFIIDRDNNLVERHVGFGDREFWEKTLVPLLEMPDAEPGVTIERVGDRIKISWSAGLSDYVLESSSGLFSEQWAPVDEPVQSADGIAFVELPINQTSQFFRLQPL